MKRLMFFSLALFALEIVLQAQAPAVTGCDRDCLKGFVTQYLDAIVAHNPGALPAAPNARFTEDTVTMPFGEGLWKTATKLRPYRQDFLDVRQGVAATHAIVEENGVPALLAARLKIVNRRVTELETMVVRSQSEGRLFNINSLTAARPAMNVVPPASQRLSREEAIRIAEFYPIGLKVGGSFASVNAPFSADAYRLENGVLAAGPGARAGSENILTQKIIPHPDLNYRIAAVDEELGLVLMRMDFGQTNSYGPGNVLTLFEAFKVYDGKIHAVEAFMEVMKEGTPSGWDKEYEVRRPK